MTLTSWIKLSLIFSHTYLKKTFVEIQINVYVTKGSKCPRQEKYIIIQPCRIRAQNSHIWCYKIIYCMFLLIKHSDRHFGNVMFLWNKCVHNCLSLLPSSLGGCTLCRQRAVGKECPLAKTPPPLPALPPQS